MTAEELVKKFVDWLKREVIPIVEQYEKDAKISIDKVELVPLDEADELTVFKERVTPKLAESGVFAYNVKATFTISVAGKKKQFTDLLLRIPALTPHKTVLWAGSEFTAHYVKVLSSGLYVSKDSKKHIGSLKSRNGDILTIVYDKENREFYFYLYHPKRTYPLILFLLPYIPIQQLKNRKWIHLIHWEGKEEFLKEANRFFKEELLEPPAATFQEAVKRLREFWDSMQFNKQQLKVVLGEALTQLNAKAIEKIVDKIYNGEVTDNLKKVHEVFDFYSQLFRNLTTTKQKRFIIHKLVKAIRSLKEGKDIKSVFPYRYIVKELQKNIIGDQNVNVEETVNSFAKIKHGTLISSFGPGGLSNVSQATMDLRLFNKNAIGKFDLVATPESEKAGLTTYLASGARVEGSKILFKVYDSKTKKWIEVEDIEDIESEGVGTLDEDKNPETIKVSGKKYYLVLKDGKWMWDTKEPRYYLWTPLLFNPNTLQVPFLLNTQGNRVEMAFKMLSQAVKPEGAEPPEVYSKAVEFDLKDPVQREVAAKILEHIGVKPADKPVKVLGTKKLEGQEIEFYEVKVGDKKVQVPKKLPAPGDFPIEYEIDEKGKFWLKPADVHIELNGSKLKVLPKVGVNLKVAYIAMDGVNFQDGVIISESAAKKLGVTKMSLKKIVLDNVSLPKSISRAKISSENKAKLESNGLPKVGAVFNPGETYLITVNQWGKFEYKKNKYQQPIKMKYVKYSPEYNTVVLIFERFIPAREGDKLTGRYGNKGVIVKVLPDEQMPKLPDGSRAELILSPLGIPSRINLGQVLETIYSHAPDKRAPMKFDAEKLVKDKNFKMIADKAFGEVELPDGTKIKTLWGKQYIMRLKHIADDNMSVAGYTPQVNMLGLPKEGGITGAKKLDLLTIYSLLSHDAKEILKDAATIRAGNRKHNLDWWMAFIKGEKLPNPRPSLGWDYFIQHFYGLGARPVEEGDFIKLVPLTDQDVEEISSGAVKIAKALDARGAPVKGGIFDPDLTGGVAGRVFAHIELPLRIVNPMYVNLLAEEFSKALGYKKSTIVDLLEGKKGIELKNGELRLTDPKPGDENLKVLIEYIQSKNFYLPKLEFFLSLARKKGIDIYKLFTLSKFPLIPPVLRGSHDSYINRKYLELVDAANTIRGEGSTGAYGEAEKDIAKLLKQDKVENYRTIYDIVKELMFKSAQGEKGIIYTFKGGQTDIENILLGRRLSMTGYGTIVNNPHLSLDEIGIPKEMAKELFKPFMIRKYLEKYGKDLTPSNVFTVLSGDVPEEVKESLLQEVANEVKVLANRAPSLHKYNILAFKPRLVEGTSIHLNPLVVKGFNADYDGDKMIIHLPVLPEAQKEAERLLPSNTVIHPVKGTLVHRPVEEYLYFLVKGTEKVDTSHKETFESKEDFERAIIEGRLHPYTYVEVKTPPKTYKGSAARVWLNLHLPSDMQIDSQVTLKKLEEIYKKLPKAYIVPFSDAIVKLARIGTKLGVGVDLKSILPNKSLKEYLLKNKDFNKALDAIKSALKKQDKSIFAEFARTGARGSFTSLAQIKVSPVTMNAHDIEQKSPIWNSYAEGLSGSEYILTAYGVRKGIIDRSVQTAEPGEIIKAVLPTLMDIVVTEHDCGTEEGIWVPVEEALGRFAAGGNKYVKAGEEITKDVIEKLLKHKVTQVKVRSILTCKAKHGVCQKCIGRLGNGELPEIGSHIGTLMGQTALEPVQQMQMNTFHTGGVGKMQTPVEAISDVLSGKVLKTSYIKTFEDFANAIKTDIVDPLRNIYASQGIKLPSNVFEVLIAPFALQFEVKDPGDYDLKPGDIVSKQYLDQAKEYYEQEGMPMPIEAAVGRVLAVDEPDIGKKRGEKITSQDAKKYPKTIVHVIPKEPTVTPIYNSLFKKPKNNFYFLSNLTHRYLHKTLEQAILKNPISKSKDLVQTLVLKGD